MYPERLYIIWYSLNFRAQFRLQSKELISQISSACISLVISTKWNAQIPLTKAVPPLQMLPAAPDISLTPVFDTTPVAITCWQTRRNTNLYFGVTPIFDTTSQKHVRIDYYVKECGEGGKLTMHKLQSLQFPPGILAVFTKASTKLRKRNLWTNRAENGAGKQD